MDAKAILFIISTTCCRSCNTESLSYPNSVLGYNYMNTGRGNKIGRKKKPVKISNLYDVEPLPENDIQVLLNNLYLSLNWVLSALFKKKCCMFIMP